MRERPCKQHATHPPAKTKGTSRSSGTPADRIAASCVDDAHIEAGENHRSNCAPARTGEAACAAHLLHVPEALAVPPLRKYIIAGAIAIGAAGYLAGAVMGLAAGSPAPFEIGHAALGGCLFVGLLGATLAAALPRPLAHSARNVDDAATEAQPPRREPAPLEEALVKAALTTQEIMIARLIAGPDPYRVIAEQLCLTESTVKFHARNIFRKTRVGNRAEFRALARAAAQRAQRDPARAAGTQQSGTAPEGHRPADNRSPRSATARR